MATSSFYDSICSHFSIAELTVNQRKAISALREGNDVFVGTKTGSGKSLIYECSPLLFRKTSTVVVIAPLSSIMKEQMERLNSLGFRAAYIGHEGCRKADIESGYYNFVFSSPELLVGTTEWREVVKSSTFQRVHKLTVVDEAHTVVQWGEAKSTEGPFREWFSHIGELRSLSIDVPVLALTATASPSNRKKIMRGLCFKSNSCIITDTPDRPNIKINVQKVPNTATITDVFSWLINKLRKDGKDMTRHLIFCTTIKDCAKIYSEFTSIVGRNCKLFEMYHSKTNESVKEHIRKDMEDANGNIRILICTYAAGMGVNYKKLNNVIHYMPSRDLDTLIQQMGRAGRDGSFSQELIIYKSHAGMLKKIQPEVLNVIKSEDKCRKQIIADSYLSKVDTEITYKHRCCDICAKSCKCETDLCPELHSASEECEFETPCDDDFIRDVSDDNLEILKSKLTTLKESFKYRDSPGSEVSNPNFSNETIKSVVENAYRLFTADDVLNYATVWSVEIATSIITIVNEVFGDVEMYQEFEEDDSDENVDL